MGEIAVDHRQKLHLKPEPHPKVTASLDAPCRTVLGTRITLALVANVRPRACREGDVHIAVTFHRGIREEVAETIRMIKLSLRGCLACGETGWGVVVSNSSFDPQPSPTKCLLLFAFDRETPALTGHGPCPQPPRR